MLFSFPKSVYRTSVLPSPLSRRRGDCHHVIFRSNNATIPRHNNTGNKCPLEWIAAWRWRDSWRNRCITDCWTEKNKRKYLFLYNRYLYIYVFVHKCLIVLYIRLFSYWKTLYSTPLHHIKDKSVSAFKGEKYIWDKFLMWRSIKRPFLTAGVSSQLSTSCPDPCVIPHFLSITCRGWALCTTETKRLNQ